jgi:hypothetical protein
MPVRASPAFSSLLLFSTAQLLPAPPTTTFDPHVVWADMRGRNGTVEEDSYFATRDLPPPSPAALLLSR